MGPNDKRQRDAFAELVADELEDIKDVLEVEKNGYAEREFSVLLDIDKMNQLYVGTSEVVSALSGRNVNIPAGNLKGWDNQGIIRMEAKASEIEKLENVLIRSNFNGQKIYLKDIAKVIDGQKEIEVFVKFNGKDATILDVKKKAHRKAATSNVGACNRLYLRGIEAVTRKTPVTSDETLARTRFGAIGRAVQQRKKNLSVVATDVANFKAQQETGYKTLFQYLWHLCADEYDAQNNG